MDLVRMLAASELGLAREALAALHAGWIVVPDPQSASCSEVHGIYQLRLRHLRSQRGAHATQLASCVSELISNLQGHLTGAGQWVSLRSNAEHQFCIFVVAAPDRALGCLRVVSKQDVSEERWHELWHG